MTNEEFQILDKELRNYALINGGYFLTPEQYEELNAAYLATGETEPLGCGVSKIWFTGIKDPFLWAGCWHDICYPDVNGEVHHKFPRDEIDYAFYRDCCQIAEVRNSLWLKIKARIYYELVKRYKVKKWEAKDGD